MAELKISDLSVGDWVLNRKGTPTKVQVITSEGNMRCGEDAKPEHSVHIWITDVSPIPITPEILEKNGFAFLPDDNTRHLRFVDGNIFISTYEGRETFALYCYNDMGWAETFSQTLRYIHQLQHALRLAGIEKEIEL